MSRLEYRLKNLQNALQKLEERSTKLKHLLSTQPLPDILETQEATIQCFEFSYELLWKSLKDYLEEEHSILVASPKKVLHECRTITFTTHAETAMLLAMADARNETSHDYDYNMAQDVVEQIIHEFYPLMKIITGRLINHKNMP